jgi:uncharacterized membrane protein YtjA (UPF0391 family)
MLYATFFFVVAVFAVVLGYDAIAAALAGFAKLLFVLGSAARLRDDRPGVHGML